MNNKQNKVCCRSVNILMQYLNLFGASVRIYFTLKSRIECYFCIILQLHKSPVDCARAGVADFSETESNFMYTD